MNKKQLLLNILANILAFLVSTGINFYLTPYITSTIGIEAYGFVPLASNFVSYITIITSAFNSMSGRFITVKIHAGKEFEAKQYFSTTFFMNMILAIFASIIFIFIVTFLDQICNVPIDIILDVKALFSLTFASTSIGLLGAIYGVPAFCQNRLDIKSIISIVCTIVRAITLVILFIVFQPKVYFIGVATVIVIIVETVLNFYVSGKLLPELKVKFKYLNFKLIFRLFNSGIWNAFNQLSSVLMTGLDLLIANSFLGAAKSGVLGIAKVVPGLIYTVVSLMITSFTPQFIQDYAHNDFKGLVKNMDYSAKLIGFISVIPLAGFTAYGEIFFKLWVPEQNAKLLMILSLLTLLSSAVSYPISAFDNVFTATNKLKWPTLATFMCGVLNILIVFILLKNTNLGIYVVAGTSSILVMIKDIFFKIPYVAKCVKISPTHFWMLILKYIFAFLVITGFSYTIREIIDINSWVSLMFVSVLTIFVGLVTNYLIMFNKNEKRSIKKTLKKYSVFKFFHKI